jgi:scyllo-inositol 2-dehydrogenase (NADP+)
MTISNFRVGLLAYGAIGDEHNQAVGASDGLVVAAVCDTNPERIAAALKISPSAKTFSDANAMLESGEIDLVIVSTPPNSHYSWAKAALSLGIHVILEKPMALTSDECDELMALAKSSNLLLVVYQNRRFDSDFLTIKSAIDQGLIGDLFSYESFVGGYGRPCDFWHSDAKVSGGAIFDWGSHFIDQILAIVPSKIEFVSGVNQKRVWDHITNADHAQVSINFAGGVQATFINSDLAAARKPKFYLLGTKGALVGNWDVSGGGAVADRSAIITLHSSDGSSKILPAVNAAPFAFHKSVANYLHAKVKMDVQAGQSRDVVAIMQAAELSALSNGLPVTPVLLHR